MWVEMIATEHIPVDLILFFHICISSMDRTQVAGLHDKGFYSLHHSAGHNQLLIVVKFILIVSGQDASSRFKHEGLLIHVSQVNLSLIPARLS